MAKKKRRTANQIAEETSYSILKRLVPPGWVIHDYKPDYGIDIVLEVFEEIEGPDIHETLGEHLFVQLKAVNRLKTTRVTKFGRRNVSIFELVEDRTCSCEIDVIKYSVETELLNTAGAMGGVPLLLVLVALDQKRAFFLCLNDYLDKIVVPEGKDRDNQKTLTLEIPVCNEIIRGGDGEHALAWYAKRPKLLAAFLRFEYQRWALSSPASPELALPQRRIHLARKFLDELLKLDLWRSTKAWGTIGNMYDELLFLRQLIGSLQTFGGAEYQRVDFRIGALWNRLVAHGHTFEEICREWYLPTLLAQLCGGNDITEEKECSSESVVTPADPINRRRLSQEAD